MMSRETTAIEQQYHTTSELAMRDSGKLKGPQYIARPGRVTYDDDVYNLPTMAGDMILGDTPKRPKCFEENAGSSPV